jgi:protein TonB
MFEDSTFESTGRIRTRSRGWMIASFAFNGSILLALILIPLIYPQALTRQAMFFRMEAPLPPAPQPKPQARSELAVPVRPEMIDGRIQAPAMIPRIITMVDHPETPPAIDIASLEIASGGTDGGNNPLRGKTVLPVVRPEIKGPVRVSFGVMAGMLIQKTIPPYPLIAKASKTQGTVVLQASISSSGIIENLHVVSGPAMLQQAALDAVKTWRYRPYLLNGQPVEVETTVNVIFTLQQ